MGTMTTANDLLTGVRSSINEPSGQTDPLRTDAEILQWLNYAQEKYIHDIPVENFPELKTYATFSGASINIPADYKLFYGMEISHTISGSTQSYNCWVFESGDTYLINNHTWYVGAYCYLRDNKFYVGPSPISGTLTYLKSPNTFSGTSVTFSLDAQHEEPIVNYASALALDKVNDSDAERYFGYYKDTVAAKGGRIESEEVKRA
jgi:hypothetical protein